MAKASKTAPSKRVRNAKPAARKAKPAARTAKAKKSVGAKPKSLALTAQHGAAVATGFAVGAASALAAGVALARAGLGSKTVPSKRGPATSSKN